MSEVTCLVVSHNKPTYCREAIDSLINQDFEDWDAVVIDSGVLFSQGYFDYIKDPRIRVVPSGETPELRQVTAMAPWCFNECFRRNLVHGRLITYLCDDDIWYPNAFRTFSNYSKKNPEWQAMYATQDLFIHEFDGSRLPAGERRALIPMGLSVGVCLDCRVDYLQFCHTKEIREKLDVWWPEYRITETHADGVFMDRIGGNVIVHPIDIKVSQNRRTPISTYIPVRK